MRLAPFAFAIPAILTAVLVAAPAHADIKWNGKMFNGIILNGWSLNGVSINGRAFNGKYLNGRTFNGQANAADVIAVSAITLPSGETIDLSR